MELDGDVSIDATEEEIWNLISDPEVLMSCVPGAEEVVMLDERTYRGTIVRGIAGITVSMDGEVHMDERNPPNHMIADVTGEDERTGSRAEAEAEMSLSANGSETTTLAYDIEMNFSGKLASVGSRILSRKIRSDMDVFFDNVRDRAETQS